MRRFVLIAAVVTTLVVMFIPTVAGGRIINDGGGGGGPTLIYSSYVHTLNSPSITPYVHARVVAYERSEHNCREVQFTVLVKTSFLERIYISVQLWSERDPTTGLPQNSLTRSYFYGFIEGEAAIAASSGWSYTMVLRMDRGSPTPTEGEVMVGLVGEEFPHVAQLGCHEYGFAANITFRLNNQTPEIAVDQNASDYAEAFVCQLGGPGWDHASGHVLL